MAKRQDNGRIASDKSPSTIHDILGFAAAGLAVETNPATGGVELRIRERGRITEIVVLAPCQAARLALKLIEAALATTEPAL